MEGDKKRTNFIPLPPKDGKTSKSANPTKLGTIKREDGIEDKRWVQKLPGNRQEVLVECMTGEIYRYLIGPLQPKIRTAGADVILSEFVRYRAFREILGGDEDHPEYRNNIVAYRDAFIHDIDGFIRVLFSSMFLEENDLSDQNYGLAIMPAPVGALAQPAGEQYGEFIKIDHGQSLNALRISDKTLLKPVYATAAIKWYPPSADADLDDHGLDKRASKNERATIWFTVRKYDVSPLFLDRVLMDFLLGRIDRGYISELKFQPSALPLYDGRLLSFFRHIPESDRFDMFETAKIESIAKIVFTKDALLRGIASHASHQDPGLAQKRGIIIDRIIANKEALFKAIRTDPDFCHFCYQNQQQIQMEINNSFQRIIHSRKNQNSERYHAALSGINPPHDDVRLRTIASVGQQFARGNIRNDINATLVAIRDIIATLDWKVRGLGGRKLKITEHQMKDVPQNAYEMARSLIRYRLSPLARCNRTIAELAWLCHVVDSKKSSWRSTETERGYTSIRGQMNSLAQRYSIVQFIMDRYNRPNSEPFLDYFELAQQLNVEVNRLNQQRGIH